MGKAEYPIRPFAVRESAPSVRNPGRYAAVVTAFDAEGADYQIDRSANGIPSASQQPVIRRGLHGQIGINQRHDLKFTQCLFDKACLRVVAQALQPRKGRDHQPAIRPSKSTSVDALPAPSGCFVSGRSRRSCRQVSRRESAFSAFVQITLPLNLAGEIEDFFCLLRRINAVKPASTTARLVLSPVRRRASVMSLSSISMFVRIASSRCIIFFRCTHSWYAQNRQEPTSP